MYIVAKKKNPKLILVRMWNNWNSYTFLVKMQIGRATLENETWTTYHMTQESLPGICPKGQNPVWEYL